MGDNTYDLKAFSRQAQHSSSDRLSELRGVSPSVFVDHMQKLAEQQVEPQPFYYQGFCIRGMKQDQHSLFNLSGLPSLVTGFRWLWG